MDDGDIQLSQNALLLNTESSSDFRALTCTHTHTCNPPGPDAVHIHTCYHTHTQVFASEEEDEKEHTKSKTRRRPLSNREAVRKYREKKKAHTAYLEGEANRLRLQHVQLVRKLQKQAILEAELLRLKSILIDLRREIVNELGVFPYKKLCTSYGQTNLSCFSSPHTGSTSSQVAISGNGKFSASWEGNCHPAIVDCRVNVEKMASTDDDGEEESIEGDG